MTAQLTFKLFGSLFILAGGAICGSALNKEDKKRLLRLDSIISLLKFIRLQIDYYCVPVGVIFERCDPSLLNACGTNKIPSRFGEFIDSIDPPLDAPVMSILRSFSNELGTSFREEQLKSCDSHIIRLTELRASVVKDMEKRKKLNRVLCFSAAAAVVILLI